VKDIKMDDLINSFSKYTGITTKNVEEVMEDIQKQTLSELDDEIHNSNLIVWEHDSDGERMNTDNLIEWLNLYYTVEKK
jgi:hypothetical protein